MKKRFTTLMSLLLCAVGMTFAATTTINETFTVTESTAVPADNGSTYTTNHVTMTTGPKYGSVWQIKTDSDIKYMSAQDNPLKDPESYLNDKQETKYKGTTYSVENKTLPNAGGYYTFTSTVDGTITIKIYLNKDKPFYVAKSDGTCIDSVITLKKKDGTVVTLSDEYKTEKVQGGTVSFAMSAGETYYVFCTGSKLGLYNFNFTSEVEKISVTTAQKGYISYSSSNALDFTNVSGIAAYRAESAGNGVVNMTKISGVVPAETGVIIKCDDAETGAEVEVPVTTEDATIGTNMLVACVSETTVAAENDKYKYVLGQNQSKELGFYLVKGSASYKLTNQAYLESTSSIATSSAKGITMNFGDDTTGINTVKANTTKADNAYYTLSGVRVAKPAKGLYIHNGKKVIVK